MIKGPKRPVINAHDCASMLAALGCVDHVLVFDQPTPHALLAALRPTCWSKEATTRPSRSWDEKWLRRTAVRFM